MLFMVEDFEEPIARQDIFSQWSNRSALRHEVFDENFQSGNIRYLSLFGRGRRQSDSLRH